MITGAAALAMVILVVVIFALMGSGGDESITAANRNVNGPVMDSGQRRIVLIEVAEGHADVYRGDQKLGMTPFRFEGRPGEELQFVLKAEGYADKAVKLSVGQQDKPYTFTLDRK